MIVEELEADGYFEVPLADSMPAWLLDDLALEDWLWATVVVTDGHWPVGVLSDANLLAQARYSGVYLGQGQDRQSLTGKGLSWWFGQDGDAGDLFVSAKFQTNLRSFSVLLANQVWNRSNGLTAGTIDATATTFRITIENGDSPREILDTLCAAAPGGPYWWRVNPDGTVDAAPAATLWPSATTPTVILGLDGGRDGGITGLDADLDVRGFDGEKLRSEVQVNWNNGVLNGVSRPSLPGTYKAFDGSKPWVRHMMGWQPRRREPPRERWRKHATWTIQSYAQAQKVAAREANERTSIRTEVTVQLPDLTDPWRFDLTPGDHVWLHDPDAGLWSAANQVHYRGQNRHPVKARIDRLSTPITEGMGVYLRRWRSGVVEYLDLTPWVAYEDGPVQLDFGTRDRFAPVRRPRKVTRRQRRVIRYADYQAAQLIRYVNAVGR